jgi:hypothetical protein
VPDVERSIEGFASTSSDVTKPYFTFLRSFSETKGQAKKHAESAHQDTGSLHKGEKTKSDEDESYPRYAYDTLYSVVKKYADCRCGMPNPSPRTMKSHSGRLELKENFRKSGNEILFHTVFSRKGSTEFASGVTWQHIQFRIPRYVASSKRLVQLLTHDSSKQRKARVGFRDEVCGDGVDDSERPGHQTEIRSTSEFCKLLNKDIGPGCMDVRIRDEVLVDLKRAVHIEVDIADERSISLADVLNQYSLVPKSKLLIAYILAKSVWQFYESDLMGVRWTTESIQLFRERENEDDDDEGGIDWAPYVTFSFEQITETESMERLPPGQFLHRYPRVLALGALLYELGRKRRPKKQAKSFPTTSSTPPLEPPTLEKMINATAGRIRRGVQSEAWPDIKLKDIQTLENYRVIVTNCVSERLFMPSPSEGSQKSLPELEEELTIGERRAMLFQKVIKPLKKLVQSTGWVDSSGNIHRSKVKGAAARRKEEADIHDPRSAALLNCSSQISQYSTVGQQDALSSSRSVSNAANPAL